MSGQADRTRRYRKLLPEEHHGCMHLFINQARPARDLYAFRIWINRGQVKLTIHPGESIGRALTQLHEEGYSYERVEYRLDSARDRVYPVARCAGVDCDGPIDHVIDLQQSLKLIESYDIRNEPVAPFTTTRSRTYDHHVIAAGYQAANNSPSHRWAVCLNSTARFLYANL